jgi:hypothetical protein
MLHAVIDTKGSGRLVGIFDDLDRALRVLDIDRPYFRLTSIPVNEINPKAVEWLLSPRKRDELLAV